MASKLMDASENGTLGSRRAPRSPLTEMETVLPERPAPDAPDSLEGGAPLESSRRRMPDKLRKYLLKVQGGKYYLPAAYRLVWFRDECPDWGIVTEVIEGGQEAGFATVKAAVHSPEGRVVATGHKTETRQDFPAGWVEKAETGAIARALAVAGFGTQFSPELDEEVFADSPQRLAGEVRRPGSAAPRLAVREAERQYGGGVWAGPGQCPRCHAPEGKPHTRQCREA